MRTATDELKRKHSDERAATRFIRGKRSAIFIRKLHEKQKKRKKRKKKEKKISQRRSTRPSVFLKYFGPRLGRRFAIHGHFRPVTRRKVGWPRCLYTLRGSGSTVFHRNQIGILEMRRSLASYLPVI